MNLSRSLANAMRYVSEAAVRIFSPSDDNYPNSGVQPFEGTLSKALDRDSEQPFRQFLASSAQAFS